ncbi:MAG: hypothetical protein ABIS30_09100 [Gallionella sp.]|jgi:hypothetical protein
MASSESPFDRKFVFAAVLIGIFYITIVVVIGVVFGANAAGYAGVAMTTLAGSIFSKFETLRFKLLEEGEGHTVAISPIRARYVLLYGVTFVGIQVIIFSIFAIVLVMLDFHETAIQIGSGEWKCVNCREIWGINYNLFVKSLVNFLTISTILIAHIAGGFLCGKTAPSVRYAYPVLGSLLSLVFYTVILLILYGTRIPIEDLPVLGVFWALYLAGAFFGSRYGFRDRLPS